MQEVSSFFIASLSFCKKRREEIEAIHKHLPKENAAEASRQLSFYQLLVSEGLGVEAEDVRLYFLRHGIEQVSRRSRSDMRETVEWIDATAGAIHREKRWEPSEGSGCRTRAFHSHCPAKTREARSGKGVWQQGALLWEMEEETDEVAFSSSATPIRADPPCAAPNDAGFFLKP